MGYKLIVKEEAVADTIEAYAWYESRQTGLGERFLKSLEERYMQISLNPTHYSYILADKEGTMRDVLVKGFPYVVIYDFVDDEVIIYAVHNCHRQPKTNL